MVTFAINLFPSIMRPDIPSETKVSPVHLCHVNQTDQFALKTYSRNGIYARSFAPLSLRVKSFPSQLFVTQTDPPSPGSGATRRILVSGSARASRAANDAPVVGIGGTETATIVHRIRNVRRGARVLPSFRRRPSSNVRRCRQRHGAPAGSAAISI